MASITIRNLEDEVKARLKQRAARHQRSMEEEARDILRTALAGDATSPSRSLVSLLHRRFAPLGGVDLEIAPREPAAEPPDLDDRH